MTRQVKIKVITGTKVFVKEDGKTELPEGRLVHTTISGKTINDGQLVERTKEIDRAIRFGDLEIVEEDEEAAQPDEKLVIEEVVEEPEAIIEEGDE